MGRTWTAVLAALLLASSGCAYLGFLKPPTVPRERGSAETEQGPAFASAALVPPGPADGDWGTYNRTLAGDRYSPLGEITPANVTRLTEVCRYETGERTPMQSGPLAVAGTIYFTSAQYTYAVEGERCRLRWRHRYEYHPRPPFDLKVNRGVAYLGGRLFRGANDGRVYALDAVSGRELWNVRAADPAKGETFPAAPVAWDGRVYIGNAGGDNLGVTGRMMALDAVTGGVLWSFELVARHGPASASWPAETERVPRAGGATWTSYAVDTVAGLIYVPTGNAAPDFLGELRPGDNLYTQSVVVLDARTGELRGWHQLLGNDWHDWDLAAAPLLIETAGGEPLVIAAGKDGHVYGLDRDGLRRRYRTPVTTIANVDAPPSAAGTRFCPGVNGGVEWNGPSYSPATGLLYLGAIDWCTTVRTMPADSLRGRDGLPWTGSARRFEPFGTPDSVRRGWLTALDAGGGGQRWRYASPTPLVAGVTATAGGLVFTGDLDGNVLALDAASGRVLWRGTTGSPIGGGVISYLAGGKQHIAVATGLHAPVTWKLESGSAALVVYALP
ncbi:MAG TPA: PQQ-binding-like beta-propeller repeat protein [Gemmatimonadales bacterium]|nr:PQQ-binding-like beta-propeller repeat protein [Gemmatimonadales bacterium]